MESFFIALIAMLYTLGIRIEYKRLMDHIMSFIRFSYSILILKFFAFIVLFYCVVIGIYDKTNENATHQLVFSYYILGLYVFTTMVSIDWKLIKLYFTIYSSKKTREYCKYLEKLKDKFGTGYFLFTETTKAKVNLLEGVYNVIDINSNKTVTTVEDIVATVININYRIGNDMIKTETYIFDHYDILTETTAKELINEELSGFSIIKVPCKKDWRVL